MKRLHALALAAALVLQAGYAVAEEAVTIEAPTGPSTSSGGTTVIVPEGSAVVVPPAPAPVVVETPAPRDAITGAPVDKVKAEEKKDESLRDQVRDKMKN